MIGITKFGKLIAFTDEQQGQLPQGSHVAVSKKTP
jgi:hypothetical protein